MVKKKGKNKGKASGSQSDSTIDTPRQPASEEPRDEGQAAAGPSTQPPQAVESGGQEPGGLGRGRGRGRGKAAKGPGGVGRGGKGLEEVPPKAPGSADSFPPIQGVSGPSQQQAGPTKTPKQTQSAGIEERYSPDRGAVGPTPSEGPRRHQQTPARQQPVQPVTLPADQKLISLKKGLADMSINVEEVKTSGSRRLALQIPHRKDYMSCGHSGRKNRVVTNHLRLNLDFLAKTVVMHYDVTIDPDKPKRLLRMVMIAVKRDLYPNRTPAFDGKKNLYSAGYLPFGQSATLDVKVWDEEREREKEFNVSLKHVAQVDMSLLTSYMKGMEQQVAPRAVPQTAIQALDIILRTAPAFKMVQVGRSFFSPPQGEVKDLGNGLEVWHGIFQSAIIGWKPFINIDVAHKGFPKVQNCVDLIGDLNKNPYDRYQKYTPNLNAELNSYDKDSLMKFLRELKVNYEIPQNPRSKRTYRVNGIAKCAREQRFQMDDQSEMSVEEYYFKMKKYKLRFPLLPVLDVGSPQRIKKIYIPLELCTVKEGQVVIRKMNELQTSEMIKVAATSTDDRKRKIIDAIKTIDFNRDPCVSQEFKISVASDFEVIESRVLDPPSLLYGANKTVTPQKGVWFVNQFLEGMKLTRWTMLNLSRASPNDLKNFVDQMVSNGKRAGMDIARPEEPFIFIQLGRRADDIRALEEIFVGYKAKKLELVFCVMDEKGDAYAQVKRMAELKVGVLTQCVKAVTIQRRMGSPATANNILMKVNSKLNGRNHTFSQISRPACLNVPTIIVGADVTHPPPDQTNTPSVAAVCASHDPKAFQYNLQYRLQPPRVEIIEDLELIMREQLMFFYSKNKQKPQKIIFYRDGVSEGQFDEVLNKEFQAIRRACKSLQANYEPGITFLVVQKRHHTRFFPDPRSSNSNDIDGRNKNVPAGTIVDTMITHPTDMDFYLVSHASIQGVSRPTKYRRLWDDNNIPEDELEKLTYYLCHMFSRCTRSVSYPAPTYYAHLAAYRVRCYLDIGPNAPKFVMTNLPNEQKLREIKAEVLKDFPMFFV